jgi:hypothetical protein
MGGSEVNTGVLLGAVILNAVVTVVLILRVSRIENIVRNMLGGWRRGR